MLESTCHCGAVRLEIDGVLDTLTDCNCSICRRYGTLWAYFSPARVTISPPSGATDIYMWDDRAIEFHRCQNCGCVTHWAPVDKTIDRMGVNARLMPLEIYTKARIRRLDGAYTEKYLDA